MYAVAPAITRTLGEPDLHQEPVDLMSEEGAERLRQQELGWDPGHLFGYRFELRKNGKLRRNIKDEAPF